MRIVVLAISLALITSACVSTPRFDEVSGVTPKTIIDTIECELITARNKLEARRRRNLTTHSLCDYVAVVDLSLQVDEQMVLAPSFAHTDVVSKSLTRAFDWGVKFDTQAQRAYSQSVTFQIRKLDLDRQRRCDRPHGGVSLNGNLGLEEVIEMGFGAIDPDDFGVRHSSDDEHVQTVGCPRDLDVSLPQPHEALTRAARPKRGGGDREGKKKNAFSTQIEFVILRNVNSTGPTWTLQHFKGPGRLFSAQRSDAHSVTVGFARADPDESLADAIGQAGQQNEKTKVDSLRNNLRLLQQRLP